MIGICSPIQVPGGGGGPNNPPGIFINGQSASSYTVEVFAGDSIVIPFQSIDNDIAPTNTPPLQNNTLTPSGFMFANDFQTQNACRTAGIEPCAFLDLRR